MIAVPRGEGIHISIFGETNVGKSSLANAITNGVFSIGIVGYDDTTEDIIEKTDLAIIMIDKTEFCANDVKMMKILQEKNKKVICVVNEKDGVLDIPILQLTYNIPFIKTNISQNFESVKEAIARNIPDIPKTKNETKAIVQQFVNPSDIVILIDSLDEGTLQQQIIRDILNKNAIAIVVGETELRNTLKMLEGKVKMVITDAQLFEKIAKIVPREILLTSFSILFANYKGDLKYLIEGAKFIEKLEPGMRILACENEDIGKNSLPKLLQGEVGKLQFEWYNSSTFPSENELKGVDLIVHCGADLVNELQMQKHIEKAIKLNIPVVNYGVLFAFFAGSLTRVLEPFGAFGDLL
ncbi:MAG: 50S ribosome-binding GTPase [Defluviitaleaceae bacterium]|nr:50S ribosome-binding GTPase [Defluviitaleaceae bacterium]